MVLMLMGEVVVEKNSVEQGVEEEKILEEDEVEEEVVMRMNMEKEEEKEEEDEQQEEEQEKEVEKKEEERTDTKKLEHPEQLKESVETQDPCTEVQQCPSEDGEPCRQVDNDNLESPQFLQKEEPPLRVFHVQVEVDEPLDEVAVTVNLTQSR
ncbi:rho GTPase-activating protein gacV-like isoform X2 [Erinaceus europaeus]|uniref:Rho GTPase-activating protein gacV-like isoform X2 n=1 Tax=Erinaceus europaeus TaxID=9365 RepID=A0ABM3XX79_ERIEU|nr:rho GTPase-activating protein gacV-like isoform X2 [Erinaceus europaeus]